MPAIVNIEKLPKELQGLVERGLDSALKKGSLGKIPIDFVQIETSLSGGKTGAAVFVARYGIEGKKGKGKKKEDAGTTFIRVLKIAPKEVCQSENEGYVKTREKLLDIFSQVEYYSEDEFTHNVETGLRPVSTTYGILLYQDVGTVAASDLKGIAKYFTNRIQSLADKTEESEKFSRELSLLMQKEVFLGLKKGLYGNLQRKNVNLSEYYGDKISDKVKQGLAALKEIDPSLPDANEIQNYFNINATYHQVAYIHGDLNPENVLVWENERGYLSCKLIDFGEVIPKKKDNFTPLFWDFSRLLGEMILNFVEDTVRFDSAHRPAFTDNAVNDKARSLSEVEGNDLLTQFWDVILAFFQNDPSKLENANPQIGFISWIYLSTLFDFINEAKSGMRDLRRAEVLQDYFYCQSLFFFFFAKFQRENPYKRLFGVKLGLKLREYASKEGKGNSASLRMDSVIASLEKFYFDFAISSVKNKKKQIGPAVGAHSPFKGLSYFEEKDKDIFFGREKFTKELIKAIEEKPIVALAGASGSGKSSVVHAGVIPLLREKNYLIFKFRPGSNPISAAIKAFDRRVGFKGFEGEGEEAIPRILKSPLPLGQTH